MAQYSVKASTGASAGRFSAQVKMGSRIVVLSGDDLTEIQAQTVCVAHAGQQGQLLSIAEITKV